jgi:hypothetical protein
VLGVMSRWPDERKRACATATVEDMFNCADRGASCHLCGLPRMRRCERIGIESDGAASRLFDERHVLGRMDTTDFSLCCRTGHDNRNALLTELGSHGLHDLESLDTLGMARWCQMIREDGRRK